MYRPFCIRVTRSTRISPHFQRVTFTGVDEMGPAGPIRDLRIKLIFPTSDRLPTLPSGDADSDANWYADWCSLPDNERGVMRTYSVRDLRRGGSLGSGAATELDIDFVLHMDNPGPAAAWAASASEGDELILIAPDRGDNSGAGIEFRPADAEVVRLFGDETALPAIAKILSEWPQGVRGSAHIEVPCAADIQELAVPDGVKVPEDVTVQWLARDGARVDTGAGARAKASKSLLGALRELIEPGAESNTAPSATSDETTGETAGESVVELVYANSDENFAPTVSENTDENTDELVWETPEYSASGDHFLSEGAAKVISEGASKEASNAAPNATPAGALADSAHLANTYFWIAGESGAVVQMRRYLVKERGVPRKQVSFMGYWKRGVGHSSAPGKLNITN